jgi:hypothetical protein
MHGCHVKVWEASRCNRKLGRATTGLQHNSSLGWHKLLVCHSGLHLCETRKRRLPGGVGALCAASCKSCCLQAAHSAVRSLSSSCTAATASGRPGTGREGGREGAHQVSVSTPD